MTAPTAKYRTAGTVARGIDLDEKPERWHPGEPFGSLDLRPGRVVLLGAPPGTGKSSLALQLVSGVLTNHSSLKAVVGNVEMAASSLVERLLARLAVVPLDVIQNRELSLDQRARIEAANNEHAAMLDRIAFLESPYSLSHLVQAMQGFNARLCAIDYCQRFVASDGEDRPKLDKLMSGVRTLANAGACVLLISSVARQKSANGSSTYSGLSMAAFRGSSELEFGADSAYLLHCDKQGNGLLEAVKNRNGRQQDIPLRFNGSLQTFSKGDPLDLFDSAQEPAPRRK